MSAQAEEEEDPVCAYPAMTEVCKKECTAPFANYEVFEHKAIKSRLLTDFYICDIQSDS